MKCIDLHYEIHVTDLEAARYFYVDQLGLAVLQDTPSMKLLAVLVGKSRMSIFADRVDRLEPGPAQVILAVENIEDTAMELQARGVTLSGPPTTAGTFLRFVTAKDPDGNTIGFAEYLRDPISPV